jgi:Fur family ferric uptake transcriptional regulator
MPKTLQDALRGTKLSTTKQRQHVFDVLSNHHEPLSMKQLHELTSEHVDRVSLYRIIDAFEKADIVKRIQVGWKYKLELSDQFHAHHHHLTCRKCEKSISFDEPKALDAALEALATKHNFLIEKHTLEIQGLCSTCKRL